jgi:hypothetical protein
MKTIVLQELEVSMTSVVHPDLAPNHVLTTATAQVLDPLASKRMTLYIYRRIFLELEEYYIMVVVSSTFGNEGDGIIQIPILMNRVSPLNRLVLLDVEGPLVFLRQKSFCGF